MWVLNNGKHVVKQTISDLKVKYTCYNEYEC